MQRSQAMCATLQTATSYAWNLLLFR